MIEYELDKLEMHRSPPTREVIDEVRANQLQALKALRQKLLDVLDHRKTAA